SSTTSPHRDEYAERMHLLGSVRRTGAVSLIVLLFQPRTAAFEQDQQPRRTRSGHGRSAPLSRSGANAVSAPVCEHWSMLALKVYTKRRHRSADSMHGSVWLRSIPIYAYLRMG